LTDGNSTPDQNNQNAGRNTWTSALGALESTVLAFNTGIPSLADLTKGLGRVSGALGFLEQGLAGLQGFSAYGATFNMSISDMIQSASSVRLSLPELASVVSENSEIMTRFGTSVEAGLDKFLSAQAEFFNLQQGQGYLAENLQRLGYTTSEINDTFLAFDAINNATTRREFRTNAERNRAAYEFAMELDRLTKLTGIERKALAEKMQENLREGNFLARENELRASGQNDMADAFNETVLRMSGFGSGIEALTKDILTRGFPVGQSRQLAGVAKDLTTVLYQAKEAMDRGDVTEYNRLMQQAAYESMELSRDENFRRLAMLSGYNEIGDIAGRTYVDLSTGLARTMQEVEQEMINSGRSFTPEEVLQEAMARVAKRQEDLINDETERNTRAVTQMIIGLRDAIFEMSVDSQKEILDRVFADLSPAAAGVDQYFNSTIKPLAESFFATLGTGFSALLNTFGVGDVQEANRTELLAMADSLSNLASLPGASPEQTALIAEIQRLATDLRTTTTDNPSQAASIFQSLQNKVAEALPVLQPLRQRMNAPMIDADVVTINVGREATVNINDGRSEGSLGATGRLFENFGNSTLMALHNIESVQTPEQMASVVRHSALGMLQAVGDVMDPGAGSATVARSLDRLAGNQTSSLQGALNTITNMNRMSPRENNLEIDFSQLTTAMQDVLVRGFKSQEDVIKELREPLERVAVASAESVNVQNRVRKGIKGMSGDIMRGIG
jgi:hypothetical protein